jgi:hypothetical protein
MIARAIIPGERLAREPWNQTLVDSGDQAASVHFWSHHALIWEPLKVDEQIDLTRPFGEQSHDPVWCRILGLPETISR